MSMWNTDLDNIQIKKHDDRRANFVLKSVHFDARSLEYDLGASGVRNLLEDRGNLSRVQYVRRHENIELRRK